MHCILSAVRLWARTPGGLARAEVCPGLCTYPRSSRRDPGAGASTAEARGHNYFHLLHYNIYTIHNSVLIFLLGGSPVPYGGRRVPETTNHPRPLHPVVAAGVPGQLPRPSKTASTREARIVREGPPDNQFSEVGTGTSFFTNTVSWRYFPFLAAAGRP